MALKGFCWARQLESNCIWGLKGTFLTRDIPEERVMICFFLQISLQSVIHVQFCKTNIYLRTDQRQRRNNEKIDGTNSCQKPARCKSAAKIGLERRRTELEGVPDSGNGDAPIDSAKNCLKQDLSDFTPVLVMGES